MPSLLAYVRVRQINRIARPSMNGYIATEIVIYGVPARLVTFIAVSASYKWWTRPDMTYGGYGIYFGYNKRFAVGTIMTKS